MARYHAQVAARRSLRLLAFATGALGTAAVATLGGVGLPPSAADTTRVVADSGTEAWRMPEDVRMGPLEIPVIGVLPPGQEDWFGVVGPPPPSGPLSVPQEVHEPVPAAAPQPEESPVPVDPEPLLDGPAPATAPAAAPPPVAPSGTPPAQVPPAEQSPEDQPPGEQAPPAQPPGEQAPPAQVPPAEQSPGEQAPPTQVPPAERPPDEQAPPTQPPAEQPPAEAPPATDTPAPAPPPQEQPPPEPPAEPDEPGDVVLLPGEPFEVRNPATGEIVLTVTVEEFTSGVACTDPAVTPVGGHLVELRLTVTTGTDLTPLGGERSVLPTDFSHVSDDGAVTDDVTAAADCRTGAEPFTDEPLTPSQQLTGTVVLDLPAGTGAVVYRPEWLTTGGEWQLAPPVD